MNCREAIRPAGSSAAAAGSVDVAVDDDLVLVVDDLVGCRFVVEQRAIRDLELLHAADGDDLEASAGIVRQHVGQDNDIAVRRAARRLSGS